MDIFDSKGKYILQIGGIGRVYLMSENQFLFLWYLIPKIQSGVVSISLFKTYSYRKALSRKCKVLYISNYRNGSFLFFVNQSSKRAHSFSYFHHHEQ